MEKDVASIIEREAGRLRSFIRARAPQEDVEDILQDVFYELVAAYRLAQPVEQAGAWLYRVARNRIIDRFRRRKPEPIGERDFTSPAAAPDLAFTRGVLAAELEAALADLPDEQREVFIANELEGISFRELAERTGVSINTLLSRKRCAVLRLRERLKGFWE